MTSRRLRPSPAPIFALASIAAAFAVASCRGLTDVPASLPTITDSGIVYAVNGAPLGAPTALQTAAGQLVAASSSFAFDLAFDIDTTGHVVLLPLRTVASGIASTHSVGLQLAQAPFDNLTAAPKSGYRADTALVVARDQPVFVQSNDVTTCGFAITGSNLYAKVVVRSVDPAKRIMNVVFTVDPDCGFVSFASGIPKT